MHYPVRAALFVIVARLCLLSAAASNSSTPEAIVIPPSEYFEGNDGPWSSFDIRVGTPEQVVRVLVSTSSPESMVVLSDYGCLDSAFNVTSAPSNCATSRGTLFNPNSSSTWNDVGTYAINGDGVGFEANLGYSEHADFALETLGIGLNGPSLENQTVAGIGMAEPLYLGVFGLNNQPVNFSSLGNLSAPSFLTTLKSQGHIPSLSWSYTAGAQYRLKQVYGQLIFSGYDTSRFDTTRTVSFTMAGDVTRDLVVVLQSISYSGSNQATLLSDPIDIFIDSTDPNLWLPDTVCDAFEQAFGLSIDNASGLYLVNDTHHNNLLSSDAQVSFRLSDVKSGGESVTITLPYDSFALQAQAPLVDNSSYYFPLKRAANSTQYTLGRVFLQEAYLSADYERKVFNVSACTWDANAQQTLVTVQSTDQPASSSSSTAGGLNGGAIAGITVGCVVFVVLIGTIIALLLRRRALVITYAAHEHDPDEVVMSGPVFNSGTGGFGLGWPRRESSSPPTGSETITNNQSLDSSRPDIRTESNTDLNHGSKLTHELHGDSSYLQTSEVAGVHELPGSRVSTRKLAGRTPMANASPSEASKAGTSSDEPNSPLVSTLGTMDWPGSAGDGGSELLSPITPVRRGSTSS